MLTTELANTIVPTGFMANLLKKQDDAVVEGQIPAPSIAAMLVAPSEAAQTIVEYVAPIPTTPLTMKLIHKMVMASYIQSANTQAKPKFPQLKANTSFDNVGFIGETATSLNKALRTGGRGLSKTRDYRNWVDSLPYATSPTLRNYIQIELADRAALIMLVRNALTGLKKLAKRK